MVENRKQNKHPNLLSVTLLEKILFVPAGRFSLTSIRTVKRLISSAVFGLACPSPETDPVEISFFVIDKILPTRAQVYCT